jgi:transposase
MELRRVCKLNYDHAGMASTIIFINKSVITLNFVEYQAIYLDISFMIGIIVFTNHADLKEAHMAKPRTDNLKKMALQESGALNAHPVRDALFSDNDFFDPRDLVQVKYEMLRKVRKDREPVSDAAASFGFSRPSFYKISADFDREGIPGLLPRKRGPRGGHKLTRDVLEFIKTIHTEAEPMSAPALVDEVESRFGIRVHRRSLERALKRLEKKTPQIPAGQDRESRIKKTIR